MDVYPGVIEANGSNRELVKLAMRRSDVETLDDVHGSVRRSALVEDDVLKLSRCSPRSHSSTEDWIGDCVFVEGVYPSRAMSRRARAQNICR